jgi:hypothetical protein
VGSAARIPRHATASDRDPLGGVRGSGGARTLADGLGEGSANRVGRAVGREAPGRCGAGAPFGKIPGSDHETHRLAAVHVVREPGA